MDKRVFVEKLYEEVAKENMDIFRDLFNKTSADNVTDPYWKQSLRFYRNLSDENKVIFFKIMQHIGIDIASHILALLDGGITLKGQDDDFDLSFSKTKEKINGDLQDLFLEIDEQHVLAENHN